MDPAARSWMETELVVAGIQPTGPLEVTRERPWSSVGRIATDQGTLWLKTTAATTAFEAGIYALLSRITPAHVLTPVAVDVAHGWLLLPDGGPTLGDEAQGAALVSAMAGAMRAYAELQRAAAAHVDTLLAAGVADMRAAVLPQRLDAALTFVPEALAERLRALRPQVVTWCAELDGLASLDHNDLHPWNMLDRGTRFYDWGDAVIAHPFACLLMPLGFIEGDLGRDPSPVLHAYLDAFADLAPRDDLVATARRAVQLSKIARAHTWERALRASPAGDPDRERFRNAPAEALAGLWGAPWERPL